MRFFILLLLIIFSAPSYSHKSSDSYLTIDVISQEISLRWDIAIRDLQNVIDLDVDGDGKIQWRELKHKQQDVFAYSLARLQLKSNAIECPLESHNMKVNLRSDGLYAVLYATGNCTENIENLIVRYEMFFDIDAQHRGLLKIQAGKKNISFAFSPQVNSKTFEMRKNYGFDTFFRFLVEGVWHIWIGFDHILFLLSLLLPAVLLRYQEHWIGVENFPKASIEVIKIVTVFTIAHSLTLSLVMLGNISLPIMLVESIIAFSVVIAALNNLYPVISQKRWLIGFVFGLIHGFGFANVLTELELNANALFVTLLGFNIGVELGQLAIVALFMPVVYLLRNGWIYQNIIFKLGSLSIASIGLVWIIQRAL